MDVFIIVYWREASRMRNERRLIFLDLWCIFKLCEFKAVSIKWLKLDPHYTVGWYRISQTFDK